MDGADHSTYALGGEIFEGGAHSEGGGGVKAGSGLILERCRWDGGVEA